MVVLLQIYNLAFYCNQEIRDQCKVVDIAKVKKD